MPQDFDPNFYQVSQPGLICPGFLAGGEPVVLEGLSEEGRLEMKLPSFSLGAVVRYDSGRLGKIRLALDTVELDLDARQIVLKCRSFDLI